MKKIITCCLLIGLLAGCKTLGGKAPVTSDCANAPVAVIKIYDDEGNLVKK